MLPRLFKLKVPEVEWRIRQLVNQAELADRARRLREHGLQVQQQQVQQQQEVQQQQQYVNDREEQLYY